LIRFDPKLSDFIRVKRLNVSLMNKIHHTILSGAALVIILLSLPAVTAHSTETGAWSAYQPLQDTAANAIDFASKKECPPTSATECRLVWKFRNRYRQPVRLTWRVTYLTDQGKQVQQKEITLTPGESPEYATVGAALDVIQVGVPKSEVRTVGVISFADAQAGRTGSVAREPAPLDTEDSDPGTRQAEYLARLQETANRDAALRKQINAALDEQGTRLQTLLEQANKHR
jgi:hypothetical protein